MSQGGGRRFSMWMQARWPPISRVSWTWRSSVFRCVSFKPSTIRPEPARAAPSSPPDPKHVGPRKIAVPAASDLDERGAARAIVRDIDPLIGVAAPCAPRDELPGLRGVLGAWLPYEEVHS